MVSPRDGFTWMHFNFMAHIKLCSLDSFSNQRKISMRQQVKTLSDEYPCKRYLDNNSFRFFSIFRSNAFLITNQPLLCFKLKCNSRIISSLFKKSMPTFCHLRCKLKTYVAMSLKANLKQPIVLCIHLQNKHTYKTLEWMTPLFKKAHKNINNFFVV